MRGWPKSLLWFALTAAIFLLQVIPFTGIFLMLLLAPFWSIVTINLGFLSLGLEALLGFIPRVWLLAPLAWFGGYAVLAYESDRTFARLDAEIRAANAGQTVRFDRHSNDLVIEANADHLGSAAASLVSSYRLPVAYTESRHRPRPPRPNEMPHGEPTFRAERLAGADACNRVRADRSFGEARVHAHIVRAADRKTSTGICAVSLPEAPTNSITRVSAKGEKLDSLLLGGKLVRITITDASGRKVELRSGQAAPLQWLPMPVTGCALNSGAPSWNCDWGFMKQKPRGLGGDGAWGRATIEVIASALRLEPVKAIDRRAEIEAADTASLDRAVTRNETTALDNLDLLIREPTRRATVHDLRGLAQRPDLLVPRADAMLEAMSAALAHGKGSSESARNLQRLIAALPAREFARIGEDLLARLDAGRPVDTHRARHAVQERIDGTLLTRLGDLGSVALPLLERNAFTPRAEQSTQAVLGLCRMGEAAAHLAERVAEQGRMAQRPNDAARVAAYVTLMRFNRADLAETLIDPESSSQRRAYERRWPGLRTGAGPEFCTLQMLR